MTTTQIRKILREHFGARRYRITAGGEIHVYGRMPDPNEDGLYPFGWYQFGWLRSPGTEARINALG